jgi:hypothetical protein
VPADHKHVAWLIVAGAVIEALDGPGIKLPSVSGAKLKELKTVEKALLAEQPGKSRNKSSRPAPLPRPLHTLRASD